MTADELRRRIDHDVDAVLDRPQQRGGHDRVVAERREPVLVRRVGDRAEVRDVVLRIAEALEVDAPGVLVDEIVDLLWMVRIEEAHFDAHALHGLGEERPGAAIEARRRDEVLPRVADREDGGRDRGLTRGEGERRCAAVHRGEPLLEDVVRRVREARVDVAELREPEECGRVVRRVEDVGGRGVDRDRARVRRRVGLLAAVDSEGAESGGLRCVAHVPSFPRRRAGRWGPWTLLHRRPAGPTWRPERKERARPMSDPLLVSCRPARALRAGGSAAAPRPRSSGAPGSAAEVVEEDVLRLDAQVGEHLDDRVVHHGRSADVVLAVLGRRVVLQVVVEEHLVDEAREAVPVVLFLSGSERARCHSKFSFSDWIVSKSSM